MANSDSENFSKIDKLLSEHDFQIDEEFDDSLLCIICKKILISACQAPCGCSFCSKCIDRHFSDGGYTCPGNTNDCKRAKPADIQRDYKADKQIAKLIVKCPIGICSYESKLLNMENHLELCTKKSAQCPFYNLGCRQDRMLNDEMNEHLQTENYSHNIIILDIHSKLKDEIERLDSQQEIDRNEISSLKQENNSKSDQIEILKDELRLLKSSNASEFEILKRDFMEKNEQERVKMVNSMNETVQILEWKMAQAKRAMRKENEKFKIEILSRLSGEESSVRKANELIDGYLLWNIDHIVEFRKKGGSIESEYFYIDMNKYKMRLLLYANGTGMVTGTGLSIYFYIYSCTRDSNTNRSFKADVTIEMVNKLNSSSNMRLTKYCEIEKLANEDLDYGEICIDKSIESYSCDWNDQFDFMYGELFANGLLQNNLLTVECLVEIK